MTIHQYRRGPGAMTLLRVALLLSALILGPSASAQETPPETPTPAVPTDTVTVEQIEGRLQAVRDNAEIDAELKAQLEELYDQTLAELRRAREWETTAAQFEQETQEAPRRIEELQEKAQESRKEIEEEIADRLPEGVEIVQDASLSQLTQLQAQVEAELAAARQEEATLRAEGPRRSERRKVIPELQSAARQTLEQLQAPAEAAQAVENPEAAEARRLQNLARRRALNAELLALEKELVSYDVRRQLLTLRLDDAVRRARRADRLAQVVREAVNIKRQQEALRATREAGEAVLAAANAPEEIRQFAESLAQENAQLTERRTGPNGTTRRIERANQLSERLKEKLIALQSDFTKIQNRVEKAGLNNATGLLLRRHQASLPDVRRHRKNVEARQTEIADTEIAQLELEERRVEIIDAEEQLESMLAALPEDTSPTERRRLEEYVRGLLTTLRQTIGALIQDYDSYFIKLTELDATEQSVIRTTREFRNFIEERVLWVRSGEPINLNYVAGLATFAREFLAPAHLVDLANAAIWEIQHSLLIIIAFGLVWGVFVSLIGRIRRQVLRWGDQASLPSCTNYWFTIGTLAYSALLALPTASMVAFVGWRFAASPAGNDISIAVGVGLVQAGAIIFTFQFLRTLLRPKGLLRRHFTWPEGPCRTSRRNLYWLLIFSAVSAFFHGFFDTMARLEWSETFGRLVFIVAMGAYVVFGHFLFRENGGPAAQILKARQHAPRPIVRRVAHLVSMATPATLIVLAGLGYYYTAVILTTYAYTSVLLILAIFLLNGLAQRWVLLQRRGWAMEQARKRRAALKAQQEAGETTEPDVSEPETDLSNLDVQTQRLLRGLGGIAFLIGAYFIWADVFPAVNFLQNVKLPWTTEQVVTETRPLPEGGTELERITEQVPVTLADLLVALIIGMLTILAVRNLPGLIEIGILQRFKMTSGDRFAMTTTITYILAAVGAIVTLGALGLGWSRVQWLVAALGLGLGFGLQEIFANFISGLIMLFERPIRIGDTVTVGTINGEVTRIQIRATTIRDWDRKELIVPNKEFITGQLTNWSLSDSILRVIIPVGIAYGSDTNRAVEILDQVAKNEPTVIDDPPHRILFLGFGDNALQFELRVFIATIDNFLTVRHNLHMSIDKAFREAGITIAFPQRDLHLKTVTELPPIRYTQEPPGGAKQVETAPLDLPRESPEHADR